MTSINIGSVDTLDNNYVQTYKYKRIIKERLFTKSEEHYGMYVCTSKPPGTKRISELLFKCSSGTYISSVDICNGKYDCNDGNNFTQSGDEQKCNCSSKAEYSSRKLCSGSRSWCSPLYYKNVDGQCKSFLHQHIFDESELVTIPVNFTCNNGLVIDIVFVDDMVSDYGHLAEDESIYKNLLMFNEKVPCGKQGQIPCVSGHSACYNVSDICMYRLNRYSVLIPCRIGSHLQECKDFQCNLDYKCPGYYCIPWGYIRDGKWDCPNGYDESKQLGCGIHRKCENMFKCRKSQICVQTEDVCNGFIDCPHEEDEILCDLIDVKCPDSCVCLNFAIMCSNITFNVAQTLPFISYHISFSAMQFITSLLENKNALFLNLTHNSIKNICNGTFNTHKVVSLDFSFNLNQEIEQNCLFNLQNLRYFYLRHNRVFLVKPKALNNLTKLLLVDLENNLITHLFKRFIYQVPKLHVLNIRNNSIYKFDLQTFENIMFHVIQTDNFKICCIKPQESQCITPNPWYMSCLELIPNMALKLSFVICSVVVMLFNCMSLIVNSILIFNVTNNNASSKIKNKGIFNIIVCSVNITDIVCGMYLAAIWFADFKFGKTYIVTDNQWRTNFWCVLTHGFKLYFILNMPLLFSCLTLARLMVVLYPFDSRFKSVRFVRGILLFLNITSVSTSIIVSSLITIPTGLCSPFIDPADSSKEVLFITTVVVLFIFL